MWSIIFILMTLGSNGLANLVNVEGHQTDPKLDSDLLDFVCQNPVYDQCEREQVSTVKFFLHTKNRPEPYSLKVGDVENLNNSSYLPGKKLKILIHGFTANSSFTFPSIVTNAYLTSTEELNVIVVDWEKGAAGSGISIFSKYRYAVACTMSIARKIANLVKFLIKTNYTTFDLVHIVGHSLGAQVSGMTGKKLDGQVSRITGLDPARPCFRQNDTIEQHRIDWTDAKFVDVIHSDAEIGQGYGAGLNEPLGHVDFYPNGGFRFQPGCSTAYFIIPMDGCSHHRACVFFAESINSQNGFLGRECDSWTEFNDGECNVNDLRVMGEHITPIKSTGNLVYFLRTASKEPFGLGEKGARTQQ